jgi:hypothetical protein
VSSRLHDMAPFLPDEETWDNLAPSRGALRDPAPAAGGG